MLCAGFGTAKPEWRRDPTSLSFTDVAMTLTSHMVAHHLNVSGVRAVDLAKACGGGDSTWRGKLNGTRAFQLQDILQIAASLDLGVLDLLPHNVADLTQLIPLPYAQFLRHTRPQGQPPIFAVPAIDWTVLANELEVWYEAERHAGRQLTLTRDVLLHWVLTTLDKAGLGSAQAVTTVTSQGAEVSWLAASVELRLVSLPVVETASEARVALRGLGEAVWRSAEESHSNITVLVVAAPQSVVKNFLEIATPNLRVGPAGGDWAVLSLSHAQRLGMDNVTPDVLIRVCGRRPTDTLVLQLKT